MSKKVKEYFENNPDEEKVFTTSDGFVFKLEMYATAHAATITDKTVTKHKNEVAKFGEGGLAVEVPVTTENEDGAEIRTKNETVDAPNIMDSPLEAEGKAEVITEVVTEQLEAVVSAGAVGTTEANADQAAADKVAADKAKAPKAPGKPKAK